MYNILLIDVDLNYVNTVISDLKYNGNEEFYIFMCDKNNIDDALENNVYDAVLINDDLILEYYDKLKIYKGKIILFAKEKECIENSSVKIRKVLLNEKNSSNKENLIKDAINEELKYLGYNPGYYGTQYLIDAIYILYENDKDGKYNYNLNEMVYPILAKKYRKTIQNIKCNIVNSTNIMVCECEEKKLLEYLGYFDYVKPSPKKIIETVINKLNEKYNLV